MGTPMAARLLQAGCRLTVWNRSVGNADALVRDGADLAASPADLTNSADIIITMLANDTVTEKIYGGSSGLLIGEVKGKLFIDMSTLRPSTVSSVFDKVHNAGAHFIDAPVSGTVGPAEKGQLLILCGASEKDLERAQPILEILGRRIIHAGPVGQGSLLKLVQFFLVLILFLNLAAFILFLIWVR